MLDPDLAGMFLAHIETERRRSAHLEARARLAPVIAFARALEVRCAHTAGHAERVACTSVLLAQAMGVTGELGFAIELGARLHDIGKVGVADAILTKAGPLDAAERAGMDLHSTLGAEMLSDAGLPPAVRDIVLAHHERWDGTGYPHGRHGYEITIGARIVAVADVYDAMRSPRPYRAAIARRTVLAHMRSHRGRHFDPDVLDAFDAIEPPEPPRRASAPVIARPDEPMTAKEA